MDSGDTSESLSFGVRLVAYHIYDLERRSEVIPWWEVTPDVVTKYKAFAQGGVWRIIFERWKHVYRLTLFFLYKKK